MATVLATHQYDPANETAAFEFLKRSRWDLRQLRKVHVYRDHFVMIDVNGDALEVRGVGYPDAAIGPLLRAINAAFDPDTVSNPTDAEYKEFFTGKAWAWAADRVM
jgi:hypothetical protein